MGVQFEPDPRFEEAKAFIRAGTFGDYDYEPLLDSLEGNEGFGRGDYFLVGVDFASYLEVSTSRTLMVSPTRTGWWGRPPCRPPGLS